MNLMKPKYAWKDTPKITIPGIELTEGEILTEETLAEVTNGKGEEDDNE